MLTTACRDRVTNPKDPISFTIEKSRDKSEAFKNKSDLEILFQGDKLLINQYSFIPINPIRHKHVKYKWTKKLENWLTSKTAEIMINSYKIDGQALFQFNAN